MFIYQKKLQYPINIRRPNPKLASVIISQYGGPDGELGASLRYLSQRYAMPYDSAKQLSYKHDWPIKLQQGGNAMPYAIYLRKSRVDLEAEAHGEGDTLARHRKTLLALAAAQQLNVTRIYEEVVSGDTIAARPQMQQLLEVKAVLTDIGTEESVPEKERTWMRGCGRACW